jgi:hypothetical protein
MKNLIRFILLFVISIVLLYLSLLIGELLSSLLLFSAAVLHLLHRKRSASLGTISILLTEAILVLFSSNLVHKFDNWLENVYEVEQVYPIKPNQVYKSILISIENVDKGSPINAAEIYLEYDKKNVTVLEVKTQDQFLKITLSDKVNKENGTVYISGGLPNPGYSSKTALFAQVLLSQSSTTQSELRVGKKSRILANDGYGTNLSDRKGGPYFKIAESDSTNTVSSEDTSNNRKILSVSGFDTSSSNSRINLVAKLFLKLNSKLLKK